jgi:protein-S-isoprenylcysteine O-methyltransferase Ste14
MKKIFQGIVLSAVFLSLILLGNWQLLMNPKILIIFILGVVANYYQAEYNPFNFRKKGLDNGTVLQIIWSVYIIQFLGLVESIYINKNIGDPIHFVSGLYLIIAVIGLWFRSWSYLTLGKFFTMHLETQSNHALITSGPYAYVRHPSYLGALVTYIFIPLFLGSHLTAMLAAGLLCLAFNRRIKFEEKMLLDKMGVMYEDFCKTRKKMIPGIW